MSVRSNTLKTPGVQRRQVELLFRSGSDIHVACRVQPGHHMNKFHINQSRDLQRLIRPEKIWTNNP